jgi:hypothetical protein
MNWKSLPILLLLVSSMAIAQQKPECTWSLKQVAGEPIRVSPMVFNVFLKDTPTGVNPNPEFKGIFVLKVTSDEEGCIVDVCPLRAPDESLLGAAIQTAKTWKAKPYFLNQKPVKIQSVVGVHFEKKMITFEPLRSSPESKN